MIIAIPTAKGGLDDVVIPNFGRALTFTLVTLDESNNIVDTRVVQNPSASIPRAAGIQTASFLAGLSVNVVISPSFGPNAYGVLQQAGIKMYIGGGTVKDVITSFVNGNLQMFNPQVMSGGPGFGYGRGMGRGFGRGRW